VERVPYSGGHGHPNDAVMDIGRIGGSEMTTVMFYQGEYEEKTVVYESGSIAGNLASITDPEGGVTGYTYDTMGNLPRAETSSLSPAPAARQPRTPTTPLGT
jgi:YD repeat-containing protein